MENQEELNWLDDALEVVLRKWKLIGYTIVYDGRNLREFEVLKKNKHIIYDNKIADIYIYEDNQYKVGFLTLKEICLLEETGKILEKINKLLYGNDEEEEIEEGEEKEDYEQYLLLH